MVKTKNYYLFSLVLFVGFLLFSELVNLGIFKSIDLKTTEAFQNYIPWSFDIPFSVFSLLGSLEISSILTVLLTFLYYKKGYINAYVILLIFAIGALIEGVGKSFLYHPAPPSTFFRTVGFIFPSKYIHTNFSYPSGHIFRTCLIIALIIFYIKKRSKHSAILIAAALYFLVMVISRFYLGEHWFSDVIGGGLLGLSFSLLAISLLSKKPQLQKN